MNKLIAVSATMLLCSCSYEKTNLDKVHDQLDTLAHHELNLIQDKKKTNDTIKLKALDLTMDSIHHLRDSLKRLLPMPRPVVADAH